MAVAIAFARLVAGKARTIGPVRSRDSRAASALAVTHREDRTCAQRTDDFVRDVELLLESLQVRNGRLGWIGRAARGAWRRVDGKTLRRSGTPTEKLVDIPRGRDELGQTDDILRDGARNVGHFVTIEGCLGVLRKDDRGLRTNARTGGAMGFAIRRLGNAHHSLLVESVHAEEAEVQALLAVDTAIVVEHGKPRDPVAGAASSAMALGKRRRSSPIGACLRQGRRGVWF